MLWFMGLWAILVYAPIAHWVWGPDGFLNSTNSDAVVKVLDFAGGTVVHVNAGVAGLMAALMLGKRKEMCLFAKQSATYKRPLIRRVPYSPRFRSLAAFGRRPWCPLTGRVGRHPKPITGAASRAAK
jgi:ammonia channel protein AmtB